jgi:hypothetical protein
MPGAEKFRAFVFYNSVLYEILLGAGFEAWTWHIK